MSDRERLAGYVDVWWEAIDDFTRLLEDLPAEEWSTPTDLPGWDVHACAAHTAHLEAVLSGAPEETLHVDPGPHVASLAQAYTEQGVVARRDATPDALINEIRESATKRRTFLLTDPPDDATEMPPRTPGRHPVELADAAAQPAARRLDARAGRTTCGRPPRRPRHRAGPAHGRLPARGDGHGARQAGRRAPGLDPGGRGRGQRAGGVRDLRHRTRRATGRRTGRSDRAAARWTARRSSSWPADGVPPTPTSVGRRAATPTWRARILAGMAITP